VTDPEGSAVDVTAPGEATADASPGAAEPPAATAEKKETGGKRSRRLLIEWIVLIGTALVIAILIKTFLFQAFYIPSESMDPTLKVGDRVLVNKLSYRAHDVHRGDIVVFTTPRRETGNGIKDLVKRVIGLPGETVEFRDGRVLVNGRQLVEPYVKGKLTKQLQDRVPAGCGAPRDGQPGCVVPGAHVFVMGDNRPASKDSRAFGPINESSIVGRVFIRIWLPGGIGFL
jgi:signal peptidase I